MSDGWGSRNEGLAHLFPGSRVGSFWFLLKECKRQGTFKADLFTLAFVTDSDDWLMMLMLLCCYVALRSLCFGIQFPANGSLCIVVPISLQRMGVKLQAEQAVAGTLRVTIHAGSMPQLAGPDFEELGSNSAKPGTIEQGQLFNIVYIVSTFSRSEWRLTNCEPFGVAMMCVSFNTQKFMKDWFSLTEWWPEVLALSILVWSAKPKR